MTSRPLQWWVGMNTSEDVMMSSLEKFTFRTRIVLDMNPDTFILHGTADEAAKDIQDPDVLYKENYYVGQSEEEVTYAKHLRNALGNDADALDHTYLCKSLIGVKGNDCIYIFYKSKQVQSYQACRNDMEAIVTDMNKLFKCIHSNRYLVSNFTEHSLGRNVSTSRFVLCNFHKIKSMCDFVGLPVTISDCHIISPLHLIIEMMRSSQEANRIPLEEGKVKFERFYRGVLQKVYYEYAKVLDYCNIVYKVYIDKVNQQEKNTEAINSRGYIDFVLRKLLIIEKDDEGNEWIIKDPKPLYRPESLRYIDLFALAISVIKSCNLDSPEAFNDVSNDVLDNLFDWIMFLSVPSPITIPSPQPALQSKYSSIPITVETRKLKVAGQDRVVRADQKGEYIIYKANKYYLDAFGNLPPIAA